MLIKKKKEKKEGSFIPKEAFEPSVCFEKRVL
jgi:hypothetical protein